MPSKIAKADYDAGPTGVPEKLDIPKLMAEIRDRVKSDVVENKDKGRPFQPFTAEFNGNASRAAGDLDRSEELYFLNRHREQGLSLNLDAVTTHRNNWLGNFIVKVKKKVLTLLWNHLLKYFVTSEKEYQAHLIRYLNDVSKYVDARDASNFWELIRKIDYDVTKALSRIERINDEQTATLRSTEKRLIDSINEVNLERSRLGDVVRGQDARLKVLESVSSGMEGILARVKDGAPPSAAASGASQEVKLPDFSYLLLENRFRGSEEAISKSLEVYPPIFKGASKSVLEIGPGRGELQALFKNAGVPSYGVDLDAAMVEVSSKKGFDVKLGDGIAHLRSLQDGSIGGVVAIQVVEHLTRSQLEELFTLCLRKVAKGGKIVFETINPRSLLALSSNYFRDPTHVWPLHPDTLSYTMTLAGLNVLEVRNLSPVADGAKLKEVPVEDYMTPRWAETVDAFNRNIRQLNDLIYGYQDYCVVAEVP